MNYFPYGYKPPKFKKILNKKNIENNKILDEDECFEKFWHKFDFAEKNPTKYKILNNSSEDILNLIKEIDL